MIHDASFVEQHRSNPKDFTRKRTLTFAHLILFLLNMIKSSIEDELESFFETLSGVAPDCLAVTKSAFTQARSKLKYSAFIALNQQLLTLAQADPTHDQRWRGFRILAVDGSVMNLPDHPALRQHFDPHAAHAPQARASQLYDVINHLTLEARLDPMKVDERTQAKGHLQQTDIHDLVLYDRGYPAFYLFACHRAKGSDFCARSPWNLYNETRDFWLSGEREQIVRLTATKEARQQCLQAGIDHQALTVRLVRVDLPSEEPEVLITSILESERIPAEAFGELYHLRWGVEEDYKKIKQRMELEQFSGYSVLAIQQDFYAKILSKNLTSLLVSAAQEQVDEQTEKRQRKRDYKVNFTRALSRMKHHIVRLFLWPEPGKQLERLIRLMASSYEAIRPGRSFERRKQRSGKFKRAR